jgi:hypothetical protein
MRLRKITGIPLPTFAYNTPYLQVTIDRSYDSYDRKYSFEWSDCRDEWQDAYYDGTNAFFFAYPSYAAAITRIRKIERRLKVKPRAQFYNTDTKNVLYMKPGRFWLWNSLRFSIFTAVFKDQSYYFAGQTGRNELLAEFLKGKTKPSGIYDESNGVMENISCAIDNSLPVSSLVRK